MYLYAYTCASPLTQCSESIMDVQQAHIPPAPSSALDIDNCSVPGESAMVPTPVLQELQTPVKEANSSSTTR